MFDLAVFVLTIKKVAFLLIFIATGYMLRRKGILKKEATLTLSSLTTLVFTTAYSVSALPKTFTMENLVPNLKLLGFSTVVMVVMILLANVLARFVGKTHFEKRSLVYILAFSNNTYFGLPVIQGVFGEEALAQFIIFCLPFNIVLCSYGYALFAPEQKGFDWKRAVFSPMFIAYVIGAVIGLTGITFPDFVNDALEGAAACMSPSSMLLAGLVLGGMSLKELLSGLRPYAVVAIRLVALPVVTAAVMYVLGIRGLYCFMAVAISALPAGLNSVVYPESMGQDASANAKICFLCCLISIITLPICFALIPTLCGPGFMV